MLKKLTQENFDKFIKKVRRIAFETPFKVAKKEKLVKHATEEDIEKIISFNEVKLIILEDYIVESNDDYIVIDNNFENCSKMIDSVVSRLINNELNRMASEGELDCYFDDEINDFRFKLKNNN